MFAGAKLSRPKAGRISKDEFEFLDDRLHQLQRGFKGTERRHLHERQCREDCECRAEGRRDEEADGPMTLQRMQVHEDEYAPESARLYGATFTANRVAEKDN